VQATPTQTRAEDGWILRGDLIEGPEPATAVAVLAHAMMANRRTMDRPKHDGLGSTLARRGLAVLNFDLRGHGDSGPSARRGGVYDYDSFVQLDLPAVIAAAREHYPKLPVALVGHSLGAHAGLIAAGRDPNSAPDAIVAIAPNMWLPRFESHLSRRLLKAAIFESWTAVTRAFGHFDSRRFGMGTDAEPLAYISQFRSMYRADRLQSADGSEDYLRALGHVRTRVLAISSTGDRLFADPPTVTRFISSLSQADVRHRIVDDRDVLPPPTHMELVTSTQCRPIWHEIADFILDAS
jgi:predicted alpha/beta hydrolase